jgi:hypothetical protein
MSVSAPINSMSRTGGSVGASLVMAGVLGALPPVGYLERWAARRGASQILQKAIAAEIGARNLFRFNLSRSTVKQTKVRAP